MTDERKKMKQAIAETRQCRSGFRCLEPDAANPKCFVDYAFGKNIMFVNSPSDVNCPYRMRFGDGSVCDCPTHFAIQAQLQPIVDDPPARWSERPFQAIDSVEFGTDEPQTIDGAVDMLLNSLSREEQAVLADMGIDEIGEATIGLVAQIRKAFGLEAGNRALYRSCSDKAGYEIVHPDDAAAEILAGLMRRLSARQAGK